MPVETRPAAELAAERLELAANVQKMRDELISAPDEVRHEKAAEFESMVSKLENIDRETQMATALENAEAMVKKLSQQPARQSPVSVQNTGFVTVNPHTGQTQSYGAHFEDASEARSSYEYRKAFDAFCGARGHIDRIKSASHRDMLERYGKSDVEPMGDNEVFVPFRKDMILGSTNNGATSFRPYAGETPNTTTSKIDTGPFTQLVLTVKTGTMYTDVSADFLADAPGMSSYIQTEASKAFAAAVDDEVINATSSMAESILACGSIGVTKTGVNNTLVATKITEAFYSFYAQYGVNLAWVMARGTHGKLVNLLDANNRSLYLPSYDAGYVPGASAQVLGAPVYFNEFMPASSVSGLKKPIIVGDWNEYYLLMRQGFTIMIDDQSLQYANRIRVTSKYRFTGGVRDPKAFNIVHESA
jgi:predicted phage gp36 major capsid-like protein